MLNVRLVSGVIAAATLLLSGVASADRAKKFEFTLQIPYLLGEKIDFEGGAVADIKDDPGIGFGFGYNFSERFALRANASWNSVGYDATRVLDDVDNTQLNLGGKLDTFSFGGAADFYLTKGRVAPFVSANLGWTNIDTNIASAPPTNICWWDPWWGYICTSSQPTYHEDFWYYGLGLGLRVDVGRDNFIRFGYYERWLDFDEAEDSPSLATAMVEFGLTF